MTRNFSRFTRTGAILGMFLLGGAGASPAAETWRQSVSAGLTLNKGNSDTLTVVAGWDATRSKASDTLRLAFHGGYGETDDATSAQTGTAMVHFRRHLKEMFVYSGTDVLHDRVAAVDSRIITGLGGGDYLWQSTSSHLSGEAGIGHLWEDAGGETDNYPVFRLALRHERHVGTSARLWGSVEYVPRAEDLGEYLLQAEAGIEAAISTDLHLRLVVRDRFDSHPPTGTRENDVSVVSGLTWIPGAADGREK